MTMCSVTITVIHLSQTVYVWVDKPPFFILKFDQYFSNIFILSQINRLVMNINTPLDRLTLVSISFMIIPIFILAYSSPQWTSEIYIYGQETNSSNNDEFLL